MKKFVICLGLVFIIVALSACAKGTATKNKTLIDFVKSNEYSFNFVLNTKDEFGVDVTVEGSLNTKDNKYVLSKNDVISGIKLKTRIMIEGETYTVIDDTNKFIMQTSEDETYELLRIINMFQDLNNPKEGEGDFNGTKTKYISYASKFSAQNGDTLFFLDDDENIVGVKQGDNIMSVSGARSKADETALSTPEDYKVI
jgi:uncharacterized beta-barrel protein YwiB (DUF1934 family)